MARLLIPCLALGLGLAACSSSRPASAPTTGAPSSTTVAPGQGYEVSGSEVVVDQPGGVAGVTIPVGARLVFRLAPAAGHHPDGSPVTWPMPTTTATAMLRPVQNGSCPDHDTCATFLGAADGTSVIDLTGPGGVICGGHPPGCAGVSSMIYRIPVQVRTGGRPAVTPRSRT